MLQSMKGRPATQIEVEAMDAICKLQDELYEARQRNLIERDMWQQRTKAVVMLLVEAGERLDGTLPVYGSMTPKEKDDYVAQWINEICAEGWIAEVKAMKDLPHQRLIEIDEYISQDLAREKK